MKKRPTIQSSKKIELKGSQSDNFTIAQRINDARRPSKAFMTATPRNCKKMGSLQSLAAKSAVQSNDAESVFNDEVKKRANLRQRMDQVVHDLAKIQVIGLGVYQEENDVDKQYKRLRNVLKEERKSIIF